MTHRVFDRNQSRMLDRIAIDSFQMSGLAMMENAGSGCARLLRELGIEGGVVICCGTGNNGGDGLVVARHLANTGVAVKVLIVGSLETLKHSADAAANAAILRHTRVGVESNESPTPAWLDATLAHVDQNPTEWIVDALLGTGSQGPLREPIRSVVRAINRTRAKRLAIDIPSGMDCDGRESNECVQAGFTATMATLKPCFLSPTTAKSAGTVRVIDIGVPREVFEKVESLASSPAES